MHILTIVVSTASSHNVRLIGCALWTFGASTSRLSAVPIRQLLVRCAFLVYLPLIHCALPVRLLPTHCALPVCLSSSTAHFRCAYHHPHPLCTSGASILLYCPLPVCLPPSTVYFRCVNFPPIENFRCIYQPLCTSGASVPSRTVHIRCVDTPRCVPLLAV